MGATPRAGRRPSSCAGRASEDCFEVMYMESIQVFKNDEFGTVRTIEHDGRAMFCGRDVALALGYSNPNKAVRDHSRGERIVHPIDTGGGTQLVQFISEGDVLRLIVSSKLPNAQRFESWVFDEVIPSVMHTGRYSVAHEDETPMMLVSRALLVAKEELDKKDSIIKSYEVFEEVAKKEIDRLTPKALFADAVAASDGTCLVGELAKMMRQNGVEVGQNRLFGWLRRDGYLGTTGGHRNVPTQRAMEQGLFRIKETAVTHSDGHVTISRTPKVTGKGQQFFIEKYAGVVE